jgi:hypothetical protein
VSFMVWLWLLGSRCETSAREPGAVGSSDLSLGPKALIDAPPCRRPEKTRTRQELAEPFPRASSGRWRFLPLHKPERNVKMPGSNCSAEFEPARYRHRTQAFHFGAPHAPRSPWNRSQRKLGRYPVLKVYIREKLITLFVHASHKSVPTTRNHIRIACQEASFSAAC